MDCDFLFFSGCTIFPLCVVLSAHMSAISFLGCLDVFIWHNPVDNFIWADNIMYLSAAHIPLPLSKYAIISSQLTLRILQIISISIFIVVYDLDLFTASFLLLRNICLSASHFHCVRIPEPYPTSASHPHRSYACWFLFYLYSGYMHIHYIIHPWSIGFPDKNTKNTENIYIKPLHRKNGFAVNRGSGN